MLMIDGGNVLKFHEVMVQPFIRKAENIEKNLIILKKEERSIKSIRDISEIFEKYERIKQFCIPKIENATGYKFSNPNLFLFVFLYKEINTVFNEALTNPLKSGADSLTSQDLGEMKEASEDRLTLAYIGDAALEIGVMASIWPLPYPVIIPRNEFLHDQRNKIIENIPLAQFWNSLYMYDSKILIQNPAENEDTLGSYVEAVFGIIYLESGLEAVEMALINLKKYFDNQKC